MAERKPYIPPDAGKPEIYRDGWIDFNKNGVKDPYEDPCRSIEERVEDLLSRMNLDDKLNQLRFGWGERLGGFAGTRTSLELCKDLEEVNKLQRRAVEETGLGIPTMLVTECIHGCMAHLCTQFPQAIALAATWDSDLVYQVAKATAREVRARGFRQCFSPVVNLARDVRCGRTEETYGEDPYLASVMAFNFCKALREEGVVATPKHFAANYIGDGGRDSHEIHLSERILRETELEPFRSSVKAGALCVMAAYNSIDGIPCSSNPWLLTEILRWEWGFEGYVVSDAWAVPGLVYKHWVAKTPEEAAAACLKAGLEVELPSVFWGEQLEKAVKEGLIPEQVLDEAVRRVLRTKFLIGLFDEPYVSPEQASKIIGCDEHRELALKAAREAIVLLKNERGILPVNRKGLRKIVVVGGAAKSLKLGGYSGIPRDIVSPLEAIKEKLQGYPVELTYVEACPIEMGCWSGIQIKNPNTGLPVIRMNYLLPPEGMGGDGVHVEVFDNPTFEEKPVADFVGLYWVGFRYEWGYGKPHPAVKSDNYSVRFNGRFNPPTGGRYRICLGVAGGKAKLLIAGRCVVDVDATGVSTYREVEIDLPKSGYDFTVEYCRTRGYAALRLGWDIVDSEDLRRALEEAREADVVLFFADVIEGEEEDRAVLRLPESQERLIEKLLEVNPNVVVILTTGSPVVGKWIYRVPGLIEAWYPGQEGGRAIADVLFGDYNPAGRLPVTWPHHEGQLPLYYNYKPSGRAYDYVNMTGAPLFPFGYGLSYTRFEYSNLKVDIDELNCRFTVGFDVENIGERDGEEVVQLYVRDTLSRIARPVRELRRFKRIPLRRGERVRVTFTLTADDLAYYDENMRRFVEPGEFEILVGSSSEDVRLKAVISVKHEVRSKPKVEILGINPSHARKSVLSLKMANTGLIGDLIPFKVLLDGEEIEKHNVYLEPKEERIIAIPIHAEPGVREVKLVLGESVAAQSFRL